jgi:hypothetical protein
MWGGDACPRCQVCENKNAKYKRKKIFSCTMRVQYSGRIRTLDDKYVRKKEKEKKKEIRK